MATGIREKLLSILEATLSKMARYDEGNPIGQIGAFLSTKPKTILNTVKNLVTDNPGPADGGSEHLGQTYIRFLCQSSEQLQTVIVDEEWVNQLFEVGKLFLYLYILFIFIYSIALKVWYEGQIKIINDWLTERLQQSLTGYQVTCLSFMIKVIDVLNGNFRICFMYIFAIFRKSIRSSSFTALTTSV
jgi:hypothetical protein